MNSKAFLALAGVTTLALVVSQKREGKIVIPVPTRNGFGPTPPNVPHDTSGSMTGTKFAALLPPGPSRDREALILAAVQRGEAKIRWGFVSQRSTDGLDIVIPVMSRCLAIGTSDDALRVTVNYRTAQAIADFLSCHLLTSKVADLIWEQSTTKLDPINHIDWVRDGSMASTKRMIEQNSILDEKVAPETDGLVANEGKQWVITKRFFDPMSFDPVKWALPAGNVGSKHNAANYGWNQRPSGKPIQSIGLAHDFAHTDYSQYLTLMSENCSIGGQQVKTADVIMGRFPNVPATLFSSEGALPGMRHPDLGVSPEPTA